MEILKSALKYTTREALVVGNHRYNFQTLLSKAIEVSRQLENCLVSRVSEKSTWGPRIGIYFRPGVEYVVATWGAWIAGGIVVPLAISHTERELQHVIEDANIRVIQTNKELKTTLPMPYQSRIYLVDEKLDSIELQTVDIPMPEERDGALIIYTSGTTGKPKGVLHTHRSLNAQMKSLSEAWGWTKEDCILHSLPLHHIHGIVNALYCAHFNGACVKLLPKFSPNAVWMNLKSGGISVFMAVPTMYSHLISYLQTLPPEEQDELKNSAQRLRLFVSGSAACPVPLMKQWNDLTGHWLLERYGMTEIGMALSNPLTGERRPGSVGFPLPSVSVKISPESQPVGELLVKGDLLFEEYWNLPEATNASFDEEGYFRTGDTVTLAGDPPYYKILGRTSVDIIKCGGYKLSALEIESIILEHPHIHECSVIGIPDETYGEIPVALVCSTSNSVSLTASAVAEFCSERMSKYKVPREVRFLDQLPRNAMGKVNKKQLISFIQNKSDFTTMT